MRFVYLLISGIFGLLLVTGCATVVTEEKLQCLKMIGNNYCEMNNLGKWYNFHYKTSISGNAVDGFFCVGLDRKVSAIPDWYVYFDDDFDFCEDKLNPKIQAD